MTPTDPLYTTQWHFALIGNIEAIWNDYDGTGVTVGVYDDGVEAGHEDLAANYNASLELVDDQGNPLPPVPVAPADGHGTAVAGIIGAANNGIGGVGVASGVSLTGINLDFYNTGLYGSINGGDLDAFRDLLAQGDAFDIVSHSWGATPLYQDYQSLAFGEDALDVQAWEGIAATGRGGLGTIVVKSAGNDNRDANGEGRDASRFTITVAATEPDGMASHYSNFGASILVTAPAAAVTTDLSGDARHPLDEVLVNSYAAPALADIDGDGDIDAVVGAMDGTLRTYINTAGVFTEVTGAANPLDGVALVIFSTPSFVDIDGDGDMDLVVGDVHGTLRTLANTAGVFTELTEAANPLNGLTVPGYSTPGFADIDGDGDMDMVVGTFNGTLRTFANTAGVFAELAGADNPFDGVDVGTTSAPSFVDLDGDGDMDAVVGSDAGTLHSFQNDGTGVFTELTGADNPFDGLFVEAYSRPSFGDIDGDGDSDMVVGEWNGTLIGFLNDGAGVFTEQVRRGYDATEYTERFSGTSASAPVVSGVVALMLQAGPGLGWRDVQDILAASATLTGSAFGAGPSAVEDGVWQTNGASTWNGGGYHLHTNYGYGMVNAYNAVRMAEVWHLFGAAETSANEVLVLSDLNDFDDTVLPDATGAGFSTTFTISDDVEIDHVAVYLSFASESVDDLEVLLTSASGTVIRAAVPNPDNWGVSTDVQWYYGVEGLRGEMSAGTWTVTVIDHVAGALTTVRAAAIDIYGSAASVDDVYHFTDEYLVMQSLQPDRDTLADTNGGVDWLNFAAVTGDILLDLAAGQIAEVAGMAWATLTTAFENAVTGDGNDTLTGTAEANILHGMRGLDYLYGAAGNDILHGGLGRDTLLGGAGNDIYILDATGDRIFETTTTASTLDAGGIDTIRSTVSFNLDAYAGVRFVERLRLVGPDDINATGNSLANVLTGNTGNNLLSGGAGRDTMLGGAGNDTYVVDIASDRVYETRTTASTVDAGGIDTVQSGVTFNLDAYNGVRFVENLVLTGTANSNGFGNALDNRLTGNAGNNVLNGGIGTDMMTGGAGNDIFVFNTAPGAGNIDRITDFNVADDTIRLDDAIFTGLAIGRLAATAFAANITGLARTVSDRIMYETDTGRLYFDSDGVGGAARVQFATLSAGLALTNEDFFVF